MESPPVEEPAEPEVTVAEEVEAAPVEAAPEPVPEPALTETVAVAEPPEEPSGAFLVGAKLGGVLPFGDLGPTGGGAVELGWVFALADRGVGATLEASYAQPTASGTETDPRVGDAEYDWKLTQRILVLAANVLYRYSAGFGPVIPYVGVGPRLYLLQSIVSGSAAGQAMPETTEQIGRVGVGAMVGIELPLGPGSLTGEALFEWGKIGNRAAGHDAAVTAGSGRLGYRMLF